MKPLYFWILISIYSLATPLTLIATLFTEYGAGSSREQWVYASISGGLFLYVGIFLWRRTFMTPFEWKKMEVLYTILIFVGSIILQGILRIWIQPKIKQ